MKASEVISKVVDEKSCKLIRFRKPIEKPYHYDIKDLFTGNKKGWIYIDLFTASAMKKVLEALSLESKPKFDNIPFHKLVTFTWKHIQ